MADRNAPQKRVWQTEIVLPMADGLLRDKARPPTKAPLGELQAAINRFVAGHNERSEPFVWTADPDKIIGAVKRGHQALDSFQ